MELVTRDVDGSELEMSQRAAAEEADPDYWEVKALGYEGPGWPYHQERHESVHQAAQRVRELRQRRDTKTVTLHAVYDTQGGSYAQHVMLA